MNDAVIMIAIVLLNKSQLSLLWQLNCDLGIVIKISYRQQKQIINNPQP